MKIVIVDDERLARAELRRLLAAIPEVEVVGEARDVAGAAEQIARVAPDLVLLDIQMPDGTGFDLLERLDDAPAVIFTTAFDHHAVRAFEVSALDYLVKPIPPDRLAQAIARARARIVAPAGAPRLGAGRRIFVRDRDRCWFVALDDVIVMVSEGNYTELVFGGGRAMIARSLTQLEARLDPELFFRANRRELINLRHVTGLAPAVDGGLAVTLTGGLVVALSRRQARRFQAQRAL